MRISADRDDIGYHDAAFHCEAYLDGKKLNHCVTADEERGEAICLVLDPDRKLVVEGDAVLREVRRGCVEVLIPEDVPDWVKAALRG